MAGIYIHIPFCKKACHYCDFHFSTSLKYKSDMLNAIMKELVLQQAYLNTTTLESIYFGGGTPSLLTQTELTQIFDVITKLYQIANNAEITLEANPDDLTSRKLSELAQTPINRLSIGIQSFHDEDLQWMNRSHNAHEATNSIKRAQDTGFDNLTIDLIYGYPLLSDTKWIQNINQATSLAIPHISAYCITVEQGTALAHLINNKQQATIIDEQGANQLLLAMDLLERKGFEQYEISNFCQTNKQGKHNANYWKQQKYVGIGPSAHSYNGTTRQWNIKNNLKYIESISKDLIPAEIETLSIENRLNEYMMTSLRTSWGMDLNKIHVNFGEQENDRIRESLTTFKENNWINIEADTVTLTKQGKLFADYISASLFATT